MGLSELGFKKGNEGKCSFSKHLHAEHVRMPLIDTFNAYIRLDLLNFDLGETYNQLSLNVLYFKLRIWLFFNPQTVSSSMDGTMCHLS